MNSKRFRGTSIEVSSNFGSRLKYLRLQKGWSQKEFSEQPSLVSRSRISIRIIGTIERSEAMRFDRRTLEILAQTLGLTLDVLLDHTPPFTQSFPSFRSTSVFTDVLKEIRIQILDDEPLIVIQGESGIGKSRLAAALFSTNLPDHVVLRFTGQTTTDFEKMSFF